MTVLVVKYQIVTPSVESDTWSIDVVVYIRRYPWSLSANRRQTWPWSPKVANLRRFGR